MPDPVERWRLSAFGDEVAGDLASQVEAVDLGADRLDAAARQVGAVGRPGDRARPAPRGPGHRRPARHPMKG